MQVTEVLSLCVWLMAVSAVKDEWRSGLTEHGALSVPPNFPHMMLKSSAMPWDIVKQGPLSQLPLAQETSLHGSPWDARVLKIQFWIAQFLFHPVCQPPAQEYTVIIRKVRTLAVIRTLKLFIAFVWCVDHLWGLHSLLPSLDHTTFSIGSSSTHAPTPTPTPNSTSLPPLAGGECYDLVRVLLCLLQIRSYM